MNWSYQASPIDGAFWLNTGIVCLVASAIFLGGFVLYLFGDMRRTRKAIRMHNAETEAKFEEIRHQIANLWKRMPIDTTGMQIVIPNMPDDTLTPGQLRKLKQERQINPAANAHKLSDGRTLIFSNHNGAPHDIDITNA